jgi:hypothetical protein
MPRNRPLRRGMARPYLRAARAALRLERGMRQSLYAAHKMMADGEHLAAADQFERLASEAMEKGMEMRAPFLYIQASRARLHSGQVQASLADLRQGLGLLAQSNRWVAVSRHGERAIIEYEQLGYTAQAVEVRHWLRATIPADAPGLATDQPIPRPDPTQAQLPAKCPYCGGNVLPDEVNWIDPTSAECIYCGSVIRIAD